MGDLSCGVILGNITKNALKLTDKGLAFYDFPEITDKKGFKDSQAVIEHIKADHTRAA